MDVKELVRRAKRSLSLVKQVSPVAAFGLGVLPIGEEAGIRIVARASGASARTLPFLLRLFGPETRFELVPDDRLREALGRVYLAEDQGVNFPTFADGDFLEREETFAILCREKVERLSIQGWELPENRLAFFHLALEGDRACPDTPSPEPEFQGGPLEFPFRLDRDPPEVYSLNVLPQEVRAFLRFDYCYLGGDFRQGIVAGGVRGLPVLLHPTEIQLAHVAPDGTLSIHLYDHIEEVRPGDTGTWAVRYWYLDLGQRQHRTLELHLRAYRVVPRDQVRLVPGPAPWSAEDLRCFLQMGSAYTRAHIAGSTKSR